jgi:hypothetical protein
LFARGWLVSDEALPSVGGLVMVGIELDWLESGGALLSIGGLVAVGIGVVEGGSGAAAEGGAEI